MTSLGRNIVTEILNEQPLMKQSSYLAGDQHGKHLAPRTLNLSSCLASSAAALPLSIACLSCGYLASGNETSCVALLLLTSIEDLLGTFLVSALLSPFMGCLPVVPLVPMLRGVNVAPAGAQDYGEHERRDERDSR